jgi:small subunit ribosomal protein S11
MTEEKNTTPAPEAEKPAKEEKKAEAVEKKVTADAGNPAEEAPKKKKKNKRKKKHVPLGKVFVTATFNNTIVTFADMQGNAIAQSSAGRCGFKGPKKSTPYAAGIIVKNAAEKVAEYGLKDVHVYVKGIGSGRDGAIRSLNANGFNILSISDTTPMPHNGCRPKKARRV